MMSFYLVLSVILDYEVNFCGIFFFCRSPLGSIVTWCVPLPWLLGPMFMLISQLGWEVTQYALYGMNVSI